MDDRLLNRITAGLSIMAIIGAPLMTFVVTNEVRGAELRALREQSVIQTAAIEQMRMERVDLIRTIERLGGQYEALRVEIVGLRRDLDRESTKKP